MNAPDGSWKTAILPWSPTSNAGAITTPPARVTFVDNPSRSSVPM